MDAPISLEDWGRAADWLSSKFPPDPDMHDHATHLVQTGPLGTLTYIYEEPDMLYWETRKLNLHSETDGDPEMLQRFALDIIAFRDKFQKLGYLVKNLCLDPTYASGWHHHAHAHPKLLYVRYGAERKVKPHDVPQEVERILDAFKGDIDSLLSSPPSEA